MSEGDDLRAEILQAEAWLEKAKTMANDALLTGDRYAHEAAIARVNGAYRRLRTLDAAAMKLAMRSTDREAERKTLFDMHGVTYTPRDKPTPAANDEDLVEDREAYPFDLYNEETGEVREFIARQLSPGTWAIMEFDEVGQKCRAAATSKRVWRNLGRDGMRSYEVPTAPTVHHAIQIVETDRAEWGPWEPMK